MSRFRRRLMALSTLKPHIKDEFVRVEYIENTSYAYINTLFKSNNKTKIEVSVELVNINKLQWIYGARNDQKNSSLAILYGAKVGTANLNYGYLRYDFGNKQNSNNNFIENKKWKISNESNVLTYTDGTEENTYTITCANNSFTCNYNLYLFNLNNRNTVSNSNAFLGKIYSCKIYEDDVLVRNYIPVLNKATDEYGMYDLVEQKFYTSPNGAKFVGGREIIYDAEIEYLESTGTQWIDTGFIPNDSSGMYVRAYCKTSGGNHIVVGTRQSYGDTRWLINFSKGIEISWNTFIAYTYSYTNTWVEVENNFLNSRLGKIDGVTQRTTYPTLASITYPVYIFTANIYGNPNTNTYTGRVSSVKISQGNEVVMDFIPVRVGNVGYMYDKVSGKLFGNDGSGEFILGEDVEVYDELKTDIYEIHPKLIANTYINESTGNQQGYNGWSSTDYIDIEGFKYAMIKISGNNLKYGAYYDKDKKMVGSTTSQVIPTTTKYVRYSTTTSDITNKNVFLFKKVVESSTPYLNNKYINRSGDIADYKGWSVFAEYNYNYVGYMDGYNGAYQASYNANGSKHQYNGYILLERPLGGKVYLSKSGTNITYGIGNKLEYKNMNE